MATTPQPRLFDWHRINADAMRAELALGLLESNARIAPKFLYDKLGSVLFEAITETDEYYPTRTEALIFAQYAAEIRHAMGEGGTLVDLGAGNCEKAMSLFPVLQPARYVAVDIAVEFLSAALHTVQTQYPTLEVMGIGQDFSRVLVFPEVVGPGPKKLFYPGSSIGNFSPDEALTFLRQVHRASAGGGLLIGFDLVKDKAILDAAYDDALGVTAAFNLNLLRVANRELSADFPIQGFRHHAFYNEPAARIEMHLVAREDVTVTWPGAQRQFLAGERIHTENSYKYTVEGAQALLRNAGFSTVQVWTDPQQWFGVFWASH